MGGRRGRGPRTALFAVLLSACAGSGDGLDENGRPLGEGGGDDTLGPTIESIQQHVFEPNCDKAGCHRGGSAPHGLRLEDPQTSYDHLVNVASEQMPTLDRVEPGDPDNSYLVHKVEGNQAVGDRMPQDGPPYLDPDTIAVIRQWITDGAPPPAARGAVFMKSEELDDD